MLQVVVAPVAQLQPGAVLGGDFRVLGLMAQGGMGAVYSAEQLSTGKPRAVKVMHPSLVADAGMKERFVQEARVGSMVPSDHVVEVVGAGIDAATGLPWLAMELLNGEDLAHYVARRGPLPAKESAVILRPVLHALAAAHSRGIVHRDIKPENIFLAMTMSSTHPMMVKVLDFGIAKVAAQALGTATTAMGSPMWMAPEQTETRTKVSPATDVWSLGLLTFWLLTGRPYWRAVQGGQSSVAQLMRELLFDPIEPAARRAAEYGFPTALPPAFDAWFARCVSREPEARFADAAQAGSQLFQSVLGIESSVTLGVLPSSTASALPMAPTAPMAPAQPSFTPAPALSGTAVPTVATTSSGSSAGLGIALLGGGAFIAAGLVAAAVIGVVAYVGLSESEETSAAPVSTRTGAGVATQAGDPTLATGGAESEMVDQPTSQSPRPLATAPPKPAGPGTQPQAAAPTATTTATSGGEAQVPPTAKTAEPEAPKKALYSPGQKVDVLWGGSWWQAQVFAVKNEKYLIHYIGWASSWDEWVTASRMRPWTGSARTK